MSASMTGFAARTGGDDLFSWSIELRSVNSKGLDIRLRLPEQLSALDPVFRKMLQKSVARGAISLSIRMERGEAQTGLALDEAALVSVIDAAQVAMREAEARGAALSAPTPTDFLAIPGVMRRAEAGEADLPSKAIQSDFEDCLKEFLAARASEGKVLDKVLVRQLGEIADLTEQAAGFAKARLPKMEQALQDNLKRIASAVDDVDPDRIAQELALLTVKADVTEEIDRLKGHIAAGHELLKDNAPVGRRLDFLMQEFNREANTLCSKAGDSDLTKCGLELKALIEQMREQVQNVE